MITIPTIALDAVGGDHGPSVIVPAAKRVLDSNSEVRLILVGDSDMLHQELKVCGLSIGPRLSIHHASQVVGMDESPAQAMRLKKDSSMRVAINLVKEGTAQACVSAGNTGALMATARFVLKTLPGIDRPAIITALPSLDGHTWVLDLGANVDCSAQQLLQFAVMGSVLASALDNLTAPRVALLNIGAEDTKGNEQVQKAAALLAQQPFNYCGFVEGDDVWLGGADVVVCDGFVGNVALKTSEGVARMIAEFMKQGFSRNIFTKIAGLVALPVLKRFKKDINPSNYNGATLIGLRGIVVKSHGGADALGFANAIKVAIVEAKESVPDRIHQQLEHILVTREAS